jgi:hypothetical protein
MEQIKELVVNYYNSNFFKIMGYYLNNDDKEHVINIGTSILCTKWNVGYPGGSFAQAVVNNDLMETFSRADDINSKVIKFYVHLIYNTRKPD